jgi:rod shape-determining protein MreD
VTRDLAFLALGFALIVLAAALGAVVDVGVLMPNPVLPLVLYLAMAPDTSLARGSALSFSLGFLLDGATGNAMGLFTFVMVASFLAARGAGFRLLVRGRVSQVLATAATAVIGTGVLIALRSIFRASAPFEALSVRHLAAAVLSPALCTGAIAPFLYQLAQRIDSARRREEGAAQL